MRDNSAPNTRDVAAQEAHARLLQTVVRLLGLAELLVDLLNRLLERRELDHLQNKNHALVSTVPPKMTETKETQNSPCKESASPKAAPAPYTTQPHPPSLRPSSRPPSYSPRTAAASSACAP